MVPMFIYKLMVEDRTGKNNISCSDITDTFDNSEVTAKPLASPGYADYPKTQKPEVIKLASPGYKD